MRVKTWVGAALIALLFACLSSSAVAFKLVQAVGSPYPTTDPAFVPDSARQVGGIAAGDFNGDGISDVAVVNATGGPTFSAGENVTVLLGGSGGLTMAPGSPVDIFLGGNVTGAGPLATGDFNGDGHIDVAVANQPQGSISILLGAGTGRLEPTGTPIPLSGSYVESIVVGDFNGDGRLDLAVLNSDLNVLLGDGSGGFTPAPGSPVALPDYASSIVAGDFNRDGRSDLAVAEQGGVMVYLSNAEGGLRATSGSPIATEGSPAAIADADLTGNGSLDLVTANPFSGDATVLLGDGSGGFAPANGSPFSIPAVPGGASSGCLGLSESIATGDFDGDGKVDLAVANFNGCSDSLAILRGDGNGGFTNAEGSPFDANGNPGPLAVGDFNGDGQTGVAVVNGFLGTVSVLQNGTSDSPETPTSTVPTPTGLTATDSKSPKDGRTGPIAVFPVNLDDGTIGPHYSPSDTQSVPTVPVSSGRKAAKCRLGVRHMSQNRRVGLRGSACRVHKVAVAHRSHDDRPRLHRGQRRR